MVIKPADDQLLNELAEQGFTEEYAVLLETIASENAVEQAEFSERASLRNGFINGDRIA